MKKILLVDDSPFFQDLLQVFLADCNFDLDVVADGQEAIDYLTATDHCDLIISDCMMPRISGIELLNYVRDQIGEFPFVFISTEPPLLEEIESQLLPLVRCLEKPFTAEDLLSDIKELLKEQQLLVDE